MTAKFLQLILQLSYIALRLETGFFLFFLLMQLLLRLPFPSGTPLLGLLTVQLDLRSQNPEFAFLLRVFILQLTVLLCLDLDLLLPVTKLLLLTSILLPQTLADLL